MQLGASELDVITTSDALEAFVERRSARQSISTRGGALSHDEFTRKGYGFAAMRLPVEVTLVRTGYQLEKAVSVRFDGYEKFHPEMAPALAEPEPSDSIENAVVFLATEKSSGAAVGSLRIETNIGTDSFLTRHYALPQSIVSSPNAWVTRLSVLKGPNQQVSKLALFKALHRYCLALQVDWIIVGAVPPMDRLYQRLGFSDVHSRGTLLPLVGHPDEQVRLMKLSAINAASEWREAGNPLYGFMFQTYLPDIKVFSSVSSRTAKSRKADSELYGLLSPVV